MCLELKRGSVKSSPINEQWSQGMGARAPQSSMTLALHAIQKGPEVPHSRLNQILSDVEGIS